MTTVLISQAQREIASGRSESALALLRASPSLLDDPAALQLLTSLALLSGQHELASERLQAALSRRPRDAAILGLAAAVAHAIGDMKGALAYAGQALASNPAERVAAAIVVEALADNLHVSEAIRVSEACLQRDPGAWGVRLSRIFAWMCAGEPKRALEDAEIARAAAPHSLPARMNCALTSLYLDEPAAVTRHRHMSVAKEIRGLEGSRMAARTPYTAGMRPLRIGFLSPDLRRHPVGIFMAPLFRHLDRQRADVVVYHDGSPDQLTATLRSLVSQWRETRGVSDTGIFDLVQHDRIDVLVDLCGYTAGGRPQLFATRCAPVQIGYLGYLHATGLATMDGILGDTETLDPGTQEGFEHPLRLPRHMLCYDPPEQAPSIAPRAPGPIRFGSFNHLAKLSPATIRNWSALLGASPGSTLILCALGLTDAHVRLQVTRRFAAAGIDGSRIELLPPEADLYKFLSRYDRVDIALDPLPFNGGTTSLQALWQGVPVLTLPGERMASRMGRSIMRNIGLDSFVAEDEADFLRIGTTFAKDPRSLDVLRGGMRDRLRACGILDGARFAADTLSVLEPFAEARMQAREIR